MSKETYRYEARSVEGFVQQLAANYLPRGYRWYVCGWVPKRKDPRDVDEKLLSKYGVSVSKYVRVRRKKRGLGNIHYLRHDRFFVLLATSGAHEFHMFEEDSIEDIRRKPIVYGNYNIGLRGGRGSVRIAREEYARLQAYFEEMATKRSVAELEAEFAKIHYARYAPVRLQLLDLWSMVKKGRRGQGLEMFPVERLELRRRNEKVFVGADSKDDLAA